MRVIRDWVDAPGAAPETVLALTRDELRRALNLRSPDQARDALRLLEAAGVLLSDSDRFERWVHRAPWRSAGRDRLLVFGGVEDPLRLRQIHRGLRYDARARGELPPPQIGRVG